MEKFQEQIEQAISSDCPKIYFNSFSMAVGPGDVIIALQLHGKPVVVLNTSYTIAKTLGKAINGSIEDLEKKTGNNIMTSLEVIRSVQNTGNDQP